MAWKSDEDTVETAKMRRTSCWMLSLKAAGTGPGGRTPAHFHIGTAHGEVCALWLEIFRLLSYDQ